MDAGTTIQTIGRFLKTGTGKTVAGVLALVLIAAIAVLTLPGKTKHIGAIASAAPNASNPPGAPQSSGGIGTAPVTGPAVGKNAGSTGSGVVVAPSGHRVDVFAPKKTSFGVTYRPAHLFSAADAYQGITANTITLCMHAAISLGPAFNETANDVTTYFRYLNAHGGVLGRKVDLTIEDDKYTAQGAQVAAQQCEGIKPFLVLGGIGFDQDPVVRSLAEQDHFLYLYTSADDGSQGTGPAKSYKYSFTSAPTIEQLGPWIAQVALKNEPGPYGAVYVNDPNWVGGYSSFKKYMDAHGGKSVDGDSYTMGSGADNSQFNSYIAQMQLHGVKTVYLWMNALGADEFVATAHNQGFKPAFVSPLGFDLVTGTVGEDFDDRSGSVGPALAGWIGPAFDPMNSHVPYWSAEKEMLDAYKQYDGGHQPDDIDWQAWLAFKAVKDLLALCGIDCNRNDIAGMFDSGLSPQTPPLCNTDFSTNHNFGGKYINLFRATRVPYVSPDYPQASQHTVWRQITTCANKFD